MGQFFLNKYVIVFGIVGNLCALDNIKAPAPPKCIARIHLYSDMWKYFDQGLYMFLIRYIYAPLRQSGFSKFLASFMCFTFVFLWHGMQTSIFIWSFLNFLGLTIENMARSIAKNTKNLQMPSKYYTARSKRRLSCVLASPLLAMSAISNFYFFAGNEIGEIYVKRMIHESWATLSALLFFLYCCCQVSVDVKNWELLELPSKLYTVCRS